MRICICDDMQTDLIALETLCKAYLEEKKLEAELVCMQDPVQVIKEDFDLLILDVEMPKMSGIEVKNFLFGRERPLIIFATNYEENMKMAFGPNVIGFMKKPVEMEMFAFYADQATRLLSIGKLVELDKGRLASTEQIIMFVTDDKYTTAVLADGQRTGLMDKSLSRWEAELVDVFFIRTSSAHLVNCKYIDRFSGDQIILKDRQKLKMSRRRKADSFSRFMEFARVRRKFV